jgi:hypothetical protein
MNPSLLTYNPMEASPPWKNIDNEHETIVAKYALHHKNEDKAYNPSCEKSKKHKWSAPFTITNFLKNVWCYKSFDPP